MPSVRQPLSRCSHAGIVACMLQAPRAAPLLRSVRLPQNRCALAVITVDCAITLHRAAGTRWAVTYASARSAPPQQRQQQPTPRMRGASSAVLTCSSVTAWCSPRRIEPLGSIRAHLLEYRSHALGSRCRAADRFFDPFTFDVCVRFAFHVRVLLFPLARGSTDPEPPLARTRAGRVCLDAAHDSDMTVRQLGGETLRRTGHLQPGPALRRVSGCRDSMRQSKPRSAAPIPYLPGLPCRTSHQSPARQPARWNSYRCGVPNSVSSAYVRVARGWRLWSPMLREAGSFAWHADLCYVGTRR